MVFRQILSAFKDYRIKIMVGSILLLLFFWWEKIFFHSNEVFLSEPHEVFHSN